MKQINIVFELINGKIMCWGLFDEAYQGTLGIFFAKWIIIIFRLTFCDPTKILKQQGRTKIALSFIKVGLILL